MKHQIKNLLWAMALIAFSSSGFGADLKVAIVDMHKVFEAYHKTSEANMAITNEAAEVEKGIKNMVTDEDKAKEEYSKAYERANDMSISAEERDKSKKAYQDTAGQIRTMETEIQKYNAREQEELGNKQKQRIGALVKDIREVLNAMAEKRGFDMVFDKSGETFPGVPVLLFSKGITDLTEDLIKELNAGALPLPGADSKPAAK